MRERNKNLNEVTKENDSLKKRIEKLEQECNSLTYYRETMLSSGNNVFSIDNFDPEMRRANQESDSLRTKLESTTIFIKKFMLAMKRLQRGVKNKDPNSKSLKIEFEKCKKELEEWCSKLKDEFMSNRPKSRSKERTFSPVGAYSQSRVYSPYIPSTGNITPKGKKSVSKTKNSRKTNLVESRTREHLDDEALIDPSHDSRYQSHRVEYTDETQEAEHKEEFESKQERNTFENQDRYRVETGPQVNLSRTTFGVKNSEPGISRIMSNEYEQLKVVLTQMVKDKEIELKQRLNLITDDLNKKTVALNEVRRTLVLKLKELEASMINTGFEYQRSLEVDAILESSHEERGESELAELLEQKRSYEKQIDKIKDSLEIVTNENADIKLELEEYKSKLESSNKELEQTLAKQKACELENQMKVFERKELEKNKEKLLKEITELKQKLADLDNLRKQEKAKYTQEKEEQVFKLRNLDSKQIKDTAKISEKLESYKTTIEKLEKDISLKASQIDDYKTKLKETQEEIKELKIQNTSLSIIKINTENAEADDAETFADDSDDETTSHLREKHQEIKDLLTSNPTKATEELYKLWLSTTKEYRILKKNKTKLEDKFEELQTDITDLKQDERASVEKMLLLEVKVLEHEKENERLNNEIKQLKSQTDRIEGEASDKENVKLAQLTKEVERLTKRLNDTTDAHRNLKTKEKKLETTNHEIKDELDELKRKYDIMKIK
jgi:hypothetical protein